MELSACEFEFLWNQIKSSASHMGIEPPPLTKRNGRVHSPDQCRNRVKPVTEDYLGDVLALLLLEQHPVDRDPVALECPWSGFRLFGNLLEIELLSIHSMQHLLL